MLNVRELERLDAEFGEHPIRMVGPSLVGFPDGVDGSRLNMDSQYRKQWLVVKNPDFPRVFTGEENKIGKHNFKTLKGTWEVVDKIEKYGNQIYSLVLYNKATDTYDIIEKKVAEDLAEKFGYTYNTSLMDSLEIGDKVKDCRLFEPTSYVNGNYCMGFNAKTLIITDPYTLEDAIKIYRPFAEKIIATEVDTCRVPINNNDIPLNIRGDEKEYKVIPDIGEKIHDPIVMATRRLNLKHAANDFQNKKTRQILNSDSVYYTGKDYIIYDMDIYCNNPDGFPDTIFFRQLKKYYDMQSNYAKNITKACKEIKKSGSKYTKNVTWLKATYQDYNDPDIPWETKDGREFANIEIYFHTMADVSAQEGYKLTGR